MQRQIAVFVGITLLAMLFVVGLVPINSSSGFASTYVFPDKGGYCPVTWNAPSGTYNPGESINATITADCGGKGAWVITNSTFGIVAYGFFTCMRHKFGGCGTDKLIFKYTAGLAPFNKPGTYNFTAVFNGQEKIFSFKTSLFTVTPQFPLGAILALVAPLAALFGYVKLRRPSPKL